MYMKRNLNVKIHSMTNIIMFYFPIKVYPSYSKYETKQTSRCVFRHKRLHVSVVGFFYIFLLIAMNNIRVSKENGQCVNVSNGFVYI